MSSEPHAGTTGFLTWVGLSCPQQADIDQRVLDNINRALARRRYGTRWFHGVVQIRKDAWYPRLTASIIMSYSVEAMQAPDMWRNGLLHQVLRAAQLVDIRISSRSGRVAIDKNWHRTGVELVIQLPRELARTNTIPVYEKLQTMLRVILRAADEHMQRQWSAEPVGGPHGG